MTEWVIHFPVSPQVEHAFQHEEIELAAKIAFFESVPAEHDIITIASRLNIQWSANYITPEGTKLIRVSGEVSDARV